MGSAEQEELRKLRKINKALMERVERSMDQQGNAYSLFQAAIVLEEQVRRRTMELSSTLVDLEQTNLQLVTAKDAAEQANFSKTRFLASASHDVLQPLNAAMLLMSSLSTIQASDEGVRLSRQVEQSLETMDDLLRNLLYMSRLDAGDVHPNWQTVSLDNLFDSIASDFEPVARVRNLKLRVKRSGLHVWSDPTMLRRTIQNIVTNALRYTREGGALLVAGRHEGKVHVRIADTGIGIEPARIKEIFVEFHRCAQGQNELDGSYAGLGLGLAIVERMVNALDIELTVNSRVDRGSCFKLTLPFKEPTQFLAGGRMPEKLSGAQLANTKILLIENDLVALKAMNTLLSQWGCDLRVASSTQETMDVLNHDKSWEPDLIIADQHLDNNERGTSIIRIVRQRTGRRLPAVVVTAAPSDRLWAMADQRRLEIMQKPVKPAQLRALLMHLRARAADLSEN
ncbi:hybrid sensor histidine kinase/response regulator [Granulosicoccus antarcticus]|uniref:histidine kinase n=1 Tax=Granulosicoccus antarcticus IMCC3135 TaxID=1192854 RepID=A0A2Z2NRR7_9GAMM|nr:hybrid sensor histidine kinase/response regulator [Granulosicoccus antarcticus]ASJ70237.1 Sensor protein TorS [Granulosicoccus antarcticus IMCC3135]